MSNQAIGKIIVEHKDRLTRFGFNYIAQLMATDGRAIEVMNETDTKDELVDDFVSVMTSMAARIYGRRNSKRAAAKVKACVESAVNGDVREEDDVS